MSAQTVAPYMGMEGHCAAAARRFLTELPEMPHKLIEKVETITFGESTGIELFIEMLGDYWVPEDARTSPKGRRARLRYGTSRKGEDVKPQICGFSFSRAPVGSFRREADPSLA